jgi:uncharacterized GH25 family protein
MDGHRREYKKYLDGEKHKLISSFKILEYDDAFIELYENYPCDSKEELFRKEGEVIREFSEMCVNKQITGRTKKEYYEDNKDKIKEKQKKRYEDKKEIISEKAKKYREKNIDNIYIVF